MLTPLTRGVALLLLLFSTFSHAQIREHFNNPSVPWHGTDTAWQINNGRLQSSCRQPDTQFWLWAPAGIGMPATWEWWMQLNFNTSSNNYVDVFLRADSSVLLHPLLAGYFVRTGGKDDEVCLHRKTKGQEQLIIDGRNGLTNKRSVTLKLKVTCDEMDTWRLWIDTTGTGLHYVQEGLVSDAQVKAPACFGIVIRQSTASFFQQHFFDEVQVLPLLKDTTPPQLLSVKVRNAHELVLQFSEWVDSTAAAYAASHQLWAPATVTQQTDGVHLTYAKPFPAGDSIQLSITGIADAAGNIMPPLKISFLYYLPTRYAVMINEIFPDPEPAVGIPLPEFIELHNITTNTIQLKDWRFIASGDTAMLSQYELTPGEYLILCKADKVNMFSATQHVLGVEKFPLLNNESDTLSLCNADGSLMHAVAYHRDWYADPIKEKGGWSLELISSAAPCMGLANWKPSLVSNGSTPGLPNSVANNTTDDSFIDLLRAYVPDSLTVELYYNKTLDSTQAIHPALYHIVPAIDIAAVTVMPPLLNTLQLRLLSPLQGDIIYTVTAPAITDCAGEPSGIRNSAAFGRPRMPDTATVIFNELLFDGTPEFVEIYNHGRHSVDLAQLYIAMQDENGLAVNPVPLSTDHRLLLPGQYLALTRDVNALCRYYTCKAAENLLQVNALPLLPNEGGTLALYNAAAQLIDAFPYSPAMQLPMAGNTKGISLERLSFEQPASDPHNWHPAAITAGYATPGMANSQQLRLQEPVGEVTVQPAIFSPDQDGMDDVAVIACNFQEPGWIGNITIFDSQGRPVRQLLQNGVLGNRNNIFWNGLDEQQKCLPAGIYIVFMEIFDRQGRVRRWKLPLALTKKRS